MNTKVIVADHEEENILIRPYYKHEMAKMYGVCYNTFINWIRPFEVELCKKGYRRNQKILTIPQVRCVFECLGEP